MANSKSVLIFGAGGFVGTYLAREFKGHGYEVFGSDLHGQNKRECFDAYRACDLTDAKTVADVISFFLPDILINLAAISSVGLSWKTPQLAIQVNVNGTLNLLDAAKDLTEPPKVLLIGSSEEYSPSDKPLKESDPIDASNPYGVSKMAQERFAEIYEKRYGLLIYRTRSFNHTGVGQQQTFVLPSWCKQVADIERSGKPGVIKVGNTNIKRDFSDVRDVVRAYRMLVESDYCGEVFNIGSGCALNLRDIANTIISFSSQKIEIELDENLVRPSDNPIVCSNCEKARHLLKWETKYSLNACLKSIYNSYLESQQGIIC